MTKYPLKAKVFEADYSQPDPDGKIASYVLDARRADEDDEFQFYVVDPMNGGEMGAYKGRHADGVEGKDNFYWVEKVIQDGS